MHVEHELPERALESGETSLQKDETRAGELCRDLEVHLTERFAEIEMLFWRERIIAFRPEMVVLDIVACVFSVGDIVKRQVGNFALKAY